MRRWVFWVSIFTLVFISTTSVSASDFFESLKKDLGKVTDTVKGAIDDITEGKEDVEEIGEDVETLKEEVTGVEGDEPRYDPSWVTEIQQRLTELGLDPGPVDGAFGKKTANAIVIFQKISQLTPDGKPRPSVMQALRAKTQTTQQAGASAAQTGAASGTAQPTQSASSSASAGSKPSDILCQSFVRSYNNLNCSLETEKMRCPVYKEKLLSCGIDPATVSEQSAAPAVGEGPSQSGPALSDDSSFLRKEVAATELRIGMALNDARASLKSLGYKESGGCLFRHNGFSPARTIMLGTDSDSSIWIRNSGAMMGAGKCAGRVTSIAYHFPDLEEETAPSDFVENLSRKADTRAECDVLSHSRAYCKWDAVPSSETVQSIGLQYKKGRGIYLALLAQLPLKPLSGAPSSPVAVDQASVEYGSGLIEPEGIAIGMPIWEAAAILKERGFREMLPCDFRVELGVGAVKRMSVSYGNGQCSAERPINSISYSIDGLKFADSVRGLIQGLADKFGADPQCRTLTDDRASSCLWEYPPNQPLIYISGVDATEGRLRVSMAAVGELESLVSVAPPPVQESPDHSWETELEQADGGGDATPVTLSGQYALLSSATRARLESEGRTVHRDCQDDFRAPNFYDCRCVAETWMNHRAEGVEQSGQLTELHKTTVLPRALKEAQSQCPNWPGTAKASHEFCMTELRLTVQESEVEEFCSCYTEESVKQRKAYLAEGGRIQQSGMHSGAMVACQ